MPRQPRRQSWTEAACFHILNRGHNRDTLFAEEADLGYLRQLLQRYRDRFHLRIYHYKRQKKRQKGTGFFNRGKRVGNAPVARGARRLPDGGP
jgi:hypothetical protein